MKDGTLLSKVTQDAVEKLEDEPKYLQAWKVLYPLGSTISCCADTPKL